MTAREAGARLPVAEFCFRHIRENLGGTYTAQVDVIHDDLDPAFFALDGSPLAPGRLTGLRLSTRRDEGARSVFYGSGRKAG
jgi:hypothetical protein